jgi:Cyclic nucleotide-binding domain/FHA domain
VDLNDVDSFFITGRSGDYIFNAGDTGAEMFIVRLGQIELSWPPIAGRSQTVVNLKPGDFFGEECLFEQQTRPASARAVTDYQLIRLDAAAFDRIVNEDPGIAVQIIRSLLQRASRPVGAQAEENAAPREPVLVDRTTGRVFPIEGEGELTVGRVSGAGSAKPAIDLSEIDRERTLSRRHALLLKRGPDVYLRAIGDARNGTFLNGKRMDATQIKLNEGDRISFGLVETVFRYR